MKCVVFVLNFFRKEQKLLKWAGNGPNKERVLQHEPQEDGDGD